ncbi:hypothetical protein [Solidesulfovibrio magneticus]|nr:hypothetical protein [Solidesulfovibrio magneticus]
MPASREFSPGLDEHSAKLDKSTFLVSGAKKVAPIWSNFAPLGLEKRAFS